LFFSILDHGKCLSEYNLAVYLTIANGYRDGIYGKLSYALARIILFVLTNKCPIFDDYK